MQDMYEGFTPAMLCRKFGFEYIRNQRTYCSLPKSWEKETIYDCQYKNDTKDDIGYRCMLLEKQV